MMRSSSAFLRLNVRLLDVECWLFLKRLSRWTLVHGVLNSPVMSTGAPAAQKKINLRRPDIMEAVQAQVLSHYRSEIVERIRASGGVLSAGDLTVKLAKEFGFCYGVERAIDLAYAARKYFSEVVAAHADLSARRNHPQPGGQRPDPQHGHQNHFAQADRRGIVPVAIRRRRHHSRLRHGSQHAQKTGGQGLRARGHDLRRRDERLEARPPIFEGKRHQHHPRQGRGTRKPRPPVRRRAPTATAIISSSSTSRKPITSAITS